MQTMKHRFSLVGVLAGLVAIVALTYMALPAIVAEAAHGGATLTLNIHVHGETFDLHPRHNDGPFYIEGDIVDVDGNAIGEFNCWGWMRSDGPPFVSQEYILTSGPFGVGAIQTQGNEGSDDIAITGGTDHFSGVSGEATYTGTTVDGFARVFHF